MITISDPETTEVAQGWTLSRERELKHHGPVAFEGETAERVFAHTATHVAEHSVLSVSIDHKGCQRGLVRVGTSHEDAPFEVTDARVEEELFANVLPTLEECYQGGARSPSVVAVQQDRELTHALVVWIEASDLELPSRQATSDTVAPIAGVELAVDTTDATPRPRPNGDKLELGEGLVAVPLATAALTEARTPIYVLAHAQRAGLVLQSLEVGADLEVLERERIEDDEVTAVFLSPGAQRDGGQELLVVWTSGLGERVRVRASVYAWRDERFALAEGPFELREATGLGTPRAAYALSGLSRAEPPGGWSIVWSESHGEESVIMASWIIAASRRPEPARRVAGDGAYPFVFLDTGSPFGFAFASKHGGASGLSMHACHESLPAPRQKTSPM